MRERIQLAGYIKVPWPLPAFVVPVFVDEGEYYVQEIVGNGVVVEWEKVRREDVQMVSDGKTTLVDGMERCFGFAFTADDVRFGTRPELETILATQPEYSWSSKLTAAHVEAFLGNAKAAGVKRAAFADEISKKDPRIGDLWGMQRGIESNASPRATVLTRKAQFKGTPALENVVFDFDPREVGLLIVEDQQLISKFLTSYCEKLGFRVVGCSSTLSQAFADFENKKPDLVLLDLTLPDGDGIDFARGAFELRPQTKIVVISARRDAWTLLQIQRVGIQGYVDKNDQNPSVIAETIKAVLHGKSYYAPTVAQPTLPSVGTMKAYLRVLSDYEIKILSLIGEAKNDEEIGALLGITSSTVQSRRRDIMLKLNIQSTPKLMHYAIVSGATRSERIFNRELE